MLFTNLPYKGKSSNLACVNEIFVRLSCVRIKYNYRIEKSKIENNGESLDKLTTTKLDIWFNKSKLICP